MLSKVQWPIVRCFLSLGIVFPLPTGIPRYKMTTFLKIRLCPPVFWFHLESFKNPKSFTSTFRSLWFYWSQKNVSCGPSSFDVSLSLSGKRFQGEVKNRLTVSWVHTGLEDSSPFLDRFTSSPYPKPRACTVPFYEQGWSV